jgi:ubiquinone/menaquinone biosynthesis C-methylase UbiE
MPLHFLREDMGFHTYPMERADNLEDSWRYEFCSVEELLALFDPGPEDVIADLGSGTGFYTDDVAPYAEVVHAVDVQEAMHEYYRGKGLPETVATVTAEIADLPFEDGSLDAAFSTMTYHEFADEDSLSELARVLRPGGKVGIVDWSAEGTGEDGPSLDERFDVDRAASDMESRGFEITHRSARRETFVLAARR